MKPILQVALDFVDLSRALKVAKEAVAGGVDWIEAGTPLIKSEGLEAVRRLKESFPSHIIIADMKIMDAGRTEVESAAKAGASIVDVLGVASDSTIIECCKAARNYGTQIIVDMINVKDPLKRAKEVEKMGANYISIHTPIDKQMQGVNPFEELKKVAQSVNIPVACAGGVNSETVVSAIKAGASIIIVGGAISKASDAKKAASEIKSAMIKMKAVKTVLYKRVDEQHIMDVLSKVSTPNLSDAMHRSGELSDIYPVCKGLSMAGKVTTVRTYPGDWAKPVEAIDAAEKGDCIIIDAGGVGPAVWGELATNSAIQKKLSGVIIYGGIRDTKEIIKLKFPAFAKIITPTAGEPKGFGEINVPITVGKMRIMPGDWAVGDDDGVVIIPKEEAVEITNRAMDVLEKENRIRKEIKEGGTLAEVTELLRWEKQ